MKKNNSQSKNNISTLAKVETLSNSKKLPTKEKLKYVSQKIKALRKEFSRLIKKMNC